MSEEKLFDNWPERYDQWFQTPIGKLVKEYESEIVLELLKPGRNEKILDAGCGTGLFTLDFLASGAYIAGLELSLPMLKSACRKSGTYPFYGIQGDMICLPFRDNCFDKTVSVTALEFIEDAKGAVKELFRVTRAGGRIVAATLNSLSPWAERRKTKTEKGRKHILEKARFRSPEDIRTLMPYECVVKTAIFFDKDDAPDRAVKIEQQGRSAKLNTGAFVAAVWEKPDPGF